MRGGLMTRGENVEDKRGGGRTSLTGSSLKEEIVWQQLHLDCYLQSYCKCSAVTRQQKPKPEAGNWLKAEQREQVNANRRTNEDRPADGQRDGLADVLGVGAGRGSLARKRAMRSSPTHPPLLHRVQSSLPGTVPWFTQPPPSRPPSLHCFYFHSLALPPSRSYVRRKSPPLTESERTSPTSLYARESTVPTAVGNNGMLEYIWGSGSHQPAHSQSLRLGNQSISGDSRLYFALSG
ncbi:hypothetical protein Q8A73_003788 [Channa argus]|nr:hypothetical protein Q8A73_003788 [Channa argus]